MFTAAPMWVSCGTHRGSSAATVPARSSPPSRRTMAHASSGSGTSRHVDQSQHAHLTVERRPVVAREAPTARPAAPWPGQVVERAGAAASGCRRTGSRPGRCRRRPAADIVVGVRAAEVVDVGAADRGAASSRRIGATGIASVDQVPVVVEVELLAEAAPVVTGVRRGPRPGSSTRSTCAASSGARYGGTATVHSAPTSASSNVASHTAPGRRPAPRRAPGSSASPLASISPPSPPAPVGGAVGDRSIVVATARPYRCPGHRPRRCHHRGRDVARW